jgi:hypothetical protein
MAIIFPDTAGQPTDGSFVFTSDGLSWIWNGSSWESSGTTGAQYILPTASTILLGGVKVDGTSITINNGVISSAGGGGGGTGLGSRSTVSSSTSSGHLDETAELITITGFKSYGLLKAVVSEPAWVILYCDNTSRVSDGSRLITEPPGSGVVAEFVTTTTNQTVLFTPAVFGFNNDSPANTSIYLRVYNKTGATTAINVSLTLIQLES